MFRCGHVATPHLCARAAARPGGRPARAGARGEDGRLAVLPGGPVRRACARDSLLEFLWPETDAVLAGHALHSRVHSLHKLLGPMMGGAAPVVYADGCYR